MLYSQQTGNLAGKYRNCLYWFLARLSSGNEQAISPLGQDAPVASAFHEEKGQEAGASREVLTMHTLLGIEGEMKII